MSPVRKPARHSNTFTGKFPSLKMGRMISFESTVERDLIYILDYDQSISEFEEQPISIEYYREGKKHHYTPDFYAKVNDQDWLYECKPEKFINTADNEDKFEIARLWCYEKGWNFKVITAEELRNGCYLKNIQYLTPFARFSLSSALRIKIFTILSLEYNPISIDNLISKITEFDHDQILSTLFQMAFYQEVLFPIEYEPISFQTCIWINKENKYEQLPFFLRSTVFLEESFISS